MENGTYITADITVKATARIRLADGETVDDFKNRRFADIYLHGYGEDGHINKIDLGGNVVSMHIGSVTKVEA
jgi:hypothetical protein